MVNTEATTPTTAGEDIALAGITLLVDLSNRRIVDLVTKLKTIAGIVKTAEPSASTLDKNIPCLNLLSEYLNIIKAISFKETSSHSVAHHIETTGPPVFVKARPLQPDRYRIVKEEFQTMMDMGICRPSKGPWASPLHVVPKKDWQIRSCEDYRRLNAVTKPDRYPIPRLQDFTYILTKKKIFSRIDINRAYHHIPIHEKDIEKTAIIIPFQLFDFPRMIFGLRNTAQTFQRFLNHTVLQGLDFLVAYIDDIIIASDDIEQHRGHLKALFSRLDSYGITINLSRCPFEKDKINFLGYKVSTSGISPLEEKVKAIVVYTRPKTIVELRRFLGMLNFYRSYLPRAAEYQAILYKHIHGANKKDKTPIDWTPDDERAFEKCKQKYSAYDRELLAMYMAIEHFRNQIEGRRLTIYTDPKPITYTFAKIGTDSDRVGLGLKGPGGTKHFRAPQKPSDKGVVGARIGRDPAGKRHPDYMTSPTLDSETPRRTRQLSFISEFTFDIRHVSGEGNAVADALSRVDEITCSTTINFEELSAAQSDDATLTHLLQDTDSSAKLKRIFLPSGHTSIVCDLTSKNARPYLPEKFRKPTFDYIHNISHPGIRTSRKSMAERYFWPNMNRDVGNWIKSYIQCQCAKVQRHVISDLGRFSRSERFGHIRVDIVGPLPTTANDYKYLLTIINRCMGWPEAFPMKDISADSVGKVVLEGWIARYGCPSKLTSDQGKQFGSNLFHKLRKLLGIDKIRTTPYHPQRLRAVTRSDTNVNAAESTFGKTLRLPETSMILTEMEAKFSIDRLKPAYVLKETDITEETSPQKVYFTPPEIPSPTSCPETPKISRSGRIIRRPKVDNRPYNDCFHSEERCLEPESSEFDPEQ
ncbi:hypothetical protein EVAR_54462_1 [Eumeta japonica]|uniref:RNA-directed DNA polymerase n=1 Tax=Eumeta variegata TaxID=151549 RepID=A0A4C1XKW4_EUMVA|nr:hypothetical protein EVAR_54462_1 [Eumeta japonica]